MVQGPVASRFVSTTLTDELLPSVHELLTSGGDGRISLSPDSGRNQYNCFPFPNGRLLALGSSTASTISERGFEAAQRTRGELLLAAARVGVQAAWEEGADRARRKLARMLELPPSASIELAPSGTDAMRAAARRVAVMGTRPVTAVAVCVQETGSGVHTALAQGLGHEGSCVGVFVRDDLGRLLPQQDVDDQACAAVEGALRGGRDCLLVVTDLTKSGLLAPSLACVAALQGRHPERITVLVDACQTRCSPATVCSYLKAGWLVVITGSKFWSGPTFSGALLALGSTARATASDCESPNFGLLVRWEAALAEAAPFYALKSTHTECLLRAFAARVQEEIDGREQLRASPSAPADRSAMVDQPTWDAIPTIFGVQVRARDGAWMNRTKLVELYRELAGLDVEIGQPVLLGKGDQAPCIIRLNASARLVVEASSSECAAAEVFGLVGAAFERIAQAAEAV